MTADPASQFRLIRNACLLTLMVALVIGWTTLTPIPVGPPFWPHLDKLAHFVAFFGLVLPLASVLSGRRTVLALAVLAVIYGGAIELIQPRVGRGAEWLDFAADAAGALAGVILGGWLRPRVLAWVTPSAGGTAESSPLSSSAAPR